MNALIIFIKNPIRGKVKTRIAATVGDDEALAIYQKLLDFTKKTTLSVTVKRYLFYSEAIENNDTWSLDFFDKKQQYGANLGERMKNAFESVFSEGYTKVAIIGSDCLELSPEILNNAFEKLEKNDFVIGPADDGGYYLIGMNHFMPSVFDNIQWSEAKVFDDTVEKINRLNKKYSCLPTLSDTDTEIDWLRLKHLLE